MIFKFVLFVCFLHLSPYSAWGEEHKSSSESIDLDNMTSKEAEGLFLLIKGLVHTGYEGNKLESIGTLMHTLRSDPDTINVTVVAAQNVYNDDGTVKEVRTIEMFVPKSHRTSVIDLDLDQKETEEFDIDDYEQLEEIQTNVQALSLLGIEAEFVYADKDKDGNVKQAVFFNKDTAALHIEGGSFINKTVRVPTTEALEESIKNIHKANNQPVSVLKFDKHGNFLKEKSEIVPMLLSTVNSEEGEPSADFIQIALQGMSEAFLESRSKREVPEKLREHLTKHVPNTFFTVTSGEPDGQYISKDYGINLVYDLTDTENYIAYNVYAKKLTEGD